MSNSRSRSVTYRAAAADARTGRRLGRDARRAPALHPLERARLATVGAARPAPAAQHRDEALRLDCAAFLDRGDDRGNRWLSGWSVHYDRLPNRRGSEPPLAARSGARRWRRPRAKALL